MRIEKAWLCAQIEKGVAPRCYVEKKAWLHVSPHVLEQPNNDSPCYDNEHLMSSNFLTSVKTATHRSLEKSYEFFILHYHIITV